MIFRLLVGMILGLLSACTSSVTPMPDKLSPWTIELRAAQPDEAFAAIYRYHHRNLIVLGGHHAVTTDSSTFRLINETYAKFKIDAVILEGFDYSLGPNPKRAFDWLARQHDENGFQMGGETVPAMQGAIAQGAVIFGGELNDSEIGTGLTANGITSENLLGFYCLRSIPQWIRERKIINAGDPPMRKLIESDLVSNRRRLGLDPSVLPDFDAWALWYQHTNGKPIGADFETEEVGPLVPGRYETNQIAAAIGRQRDSFLLEIIAGRLNADQTTLVVFGGSHLMILRSALDAMLGLPCYVGADMNAAAKACGL
jgi:hypothetical protein